MNLWVAVCPSGRCQLFAVLFEEAKVVPSLGRVVTLLAEFFCKLLYVCPRLLRFAGVYFVQVSAFQKRSSQ